MAFGRIVNIEYQSEQDNEIAFKSVVDWTIVFMPFRIFATPFCEIPIYGRRKLHFHLFCKYVLHPLFGLLNDSHDLASKAFRVFGFTEGWQLSCEWCPLYVQSHWEQPPVFLTVPNQSFAASCSFRIRSSCAEIFRAFWFVSLTRHALLAVATYACILAGRASLFVSIASISSSFRCVWMQLFESAFSFKNHGQDQHKGCCIGVYSWTVLHLFSLAQEK